MTHFSRCRSKCTLLVVASLTAAMAHAQSFTDAGIDFPDSSAGLAKWVDYDHDHDLDVFLPASPPYFANHVFMRNDSGSFTRMGALGIAPLGTNSSEFGDCDGDNDLDLLLAGTLPGSSSKTVRIYLNQDTAFVAGPTVSTTASYALWADMDNNGWLDVVTYYGSDGIRIYHNDGSTFTPMAGSLGSGSASEVNTFDLDNDGDLDLVGSFFMLGAIKLFRNDEGAWPEQDISHITTGRTVDVTVWMDFNRDGYTDLVANDAYPGIDSILFFANEGGTFPTLSHAWPDQTLRYGYPGDMNNDGYLDLAIGGISGASSLSWVTHHAGGAWLTLPGASTGFTTAGGWGDYDNDGDLDLLRTTGAPSAVPKTRILRNDTLMAPYQTNSPPAQVTGLSIMALGDSSAQLSWNMGSDLQTPSLGLSYRLWIGTALDSFNVASAWADTSTGFRRVVTRGNIQDTTWVLNGLKPGLTYYAAVTAVDGAWEGSQPSEKVSLVLVGSADRGTPIHFTAGPNPTTGSMQVHAGVADTYNYQVLDAQGRASGIAGQFTTDTRLELGSLAQGIYHLVISSRSGWKTSLRVIKS